MLLLSLVAAIALPQLGTFYERLVVAIEKDDVMSEIAALGYRAYSQGQRYVLDQYPSEKAAALPIEIAKGWRLIAEQPIEYLSNGVCTGGRLHVIYGAQETVLDLEPPFCRPT